MVVTMRCTSYWRSEGGLTGPRVGHGEWGSRC